GGEASPDAAGEGLTTGSEPTDADAPRRGGTLTYLFSGSLAPPNWDPITPGIVGVPGGPAMWLEAIYGLLVYEDSETGEVVPWMAESITPEGASKWTVTLRPDVEITVGPPSDAA